MATWQIEPLGPWTQAVTKTRASAARFKVTAGQRRVSPSWPEVRDGLLGEIDYLSPLGTVAIRLDTERSTSAGLPRSGAFPGAAVSFRSRLHGDLTYATDNYEVWWANLRAIALSLEALRAVDRYGVTRSGEQYVGWRQIEATAAAPFSDAESAARWLRTRLVDLGVAEARTATVALRRVAVREMHPDRTGDRAQWDLLERAIELMRAGGLL